MQQIATGTGNQIVEGYIVLGRSRDHRVVGNLHSTRVNHCTGSYTRHAVLQRNDAGKSLFNVGPLFKRAGSLVSFYSLYKVALLAVQSRNTQLLMNSVGILLTHANTLSQSVKILRLFT